MQATRRNLIRLAGAALAAGGPAAAKAVEPIGIFANDHAAKAIGRAWLGDPTAPRAELLASLRVTLTEALQCDSLAWSDATIDPPRARLNARIRRDFAEGHVVVVDGWILSRAEAQACGIAYLEAEEMTWTPLIRDDNVDHRVKS